MTSKDTFKSMTQQIKKYSRQKVLALYKRTLCIRIVEEVIAEAYPWQHMRCPVHLSIGQEAISAGVCLALNKNDIVFASHRSHGAYLAKGGNMEALFAELHGKLTGCTQGRGGSMHLSALEVGFWGAIPILASSIAIASGVALAFHMRQESHVSVVFMGEGATEEGTFHESLQFAALKKLPVIFICENNGFSVNTPLSERRSPHASLLALARAHGVRAMRGDGNNALEVFALAKEAVALARKGQGPSFLEFPTYRWLEHCGPNDDHHLPNRNTTEFKMWQARCPVVFLQNILEEAYDVPPLSLQNMRNKIQKCAYAALAAAEKAPWPPVSSVASHVYATGELHA